MPVRVGEPVFGIIHRRPRHQSLRSKNHIVVHASTGDCRRPEEMSAVIAQILISGHLKKLSL